MAMALLVVSSLVGWLLFRDFSTRTALNRATERVAALESRIDQVVSVLVGGSSLAALEDAQALTDDQRANRVAAFRALLKAAPSYDRAEMLRDMVDNEPWLTNQDMKELVAVVPRYDRNAVYNHYCFRYRRARQAS